jgi:hypothetical protein
MAGNRRAATHQIGVAAGHVADGLFIVKGEAR